MTEGVAFGFFLSKEKILAAQTVWSSRQDHLTPSSSSPLFILRI